MNRYCWLFFPIINYYISTIVGNISAIITPYYQQLFMAITPRNHHQPVSTTGNKTQRQESDSHRDGESLIHQLSFQDVLNLRGDAQRVAT